MVNFPKDPLDALKFAFTDKLNKAKSKLGTAKSKAKEKLEGLTSKKGEEQIKGTSEETSTKTHAGKWFKSAGDKIQEGAGRAWKEVKGAARVAKGTLDSKMEKAGAHLEEMKATVSPAISKIFKPKQEKEIMISLGSSKEAIDRCLGTVLLKDADSEGLNKQLQLDIKRMNSSKKDEEGKPIVRTILIEEEPYQFPKIDNPDQNTSWQTLVPKTLKSWLPDPEDQRNAMALLTQGGVGDAVQELLNRAPGMKPFDKAMDFAFRNIETDRGYDVVLTRLDVFELTDIDPEGTKPPEKWIATTTICVNNPNEPATLTLRKMEAPTGS
jgi:hypothetical protein